jgi:prolipoprotein diacylglyceryltransferase
VHFPVVLRLGALALPAHAACESLGYFTGWRVYLALRARSRDAVSGATRLALVAAAAVGALAGSHLLAWAQHAAEHGGESLATGRTIVGGLLGGWIAVEWLKRALGERRRTGDLFVLPLCTGIAIGRVGCFLAGLGDPTYGLPTTLPWGVDFGDGVPRHPAQLYEIAALALIAWWSVRARRRIAAGALAEGDAFRGFMTSYLLFRLALEWLKPGFRVVPGLTAIQLACIAGLLYCARDWPRLFGRTRPPRESRG